ncbi:hypothetical protein ACOMHN_002584 [Nucella lapillus]
MKTVECSWRARRLCYTVTVYSVHTHENRGVFVESPEALLHSYSVQRAHLRKPWNVRGEPGELCQAVYPDSKLAKMFNGNIPIVLDTLKQHYFIDRDGQLFRFILNYLRTQRLIVPEKFDEYEQLYEEARYYELAGLLRELESVKKSKELNEIAKVAREIKTEKGVSPAVPATENGGFIDCIAVSISPDLGERISLSAEKPLIEEMFPELTSALMDTRNSGWNMDNPYVIRFPLNGFCKLNSVQVIQRLLNNAFKIIASSGGGVEGQQFTEYVFARTCKAARITVRAWGNFSTEERKREGLGSFQLTRMLGFEPVEVFTLGFEPVEVFTLGFEPVEMFTLGFEPVEVFTLGFEPVEVFTLGFEPVEVFTLGFEPVEVFTLGFEPVEVFTLGFEPVEVFTTSLWIPMQAFNS